MYWKDDIPKISDSSFGNKNLEVELVTGDYQDIIAPMAPKNSWANDKKNDVAVWIIRLNERGEFFIPQTQSGANRNLYILKSSNIEIDREIIQIIQW